MGIRTEVSEMWAVGTMNEDYLGYLGLSIKLNSIIVVLINVVDPWLNRLLSYECIAQNGWLLIRSKPRNCQSRAIAFTTIIRILGI